jgi:hypothetical protein
VGLKRRTALMLEALIWLGAAALMVLVIALVTKF